MDKYGHGHVVPRPDKVKARCGGPALCSECAKELKDLQQKFIEVYAKPRLEELFLLQANGLLSDFKKVEISVVTGWIEGTIELPQEFSTLRFCTGAYLEQSNRSISQSGPNLLPMNGNGS